MQQSESAQATLDADLPQLKGELINMKGKGS